MARRLEVEIVGDARQLERALGSAGKTTSGFSNSLRKASYVAIGALGGIAVAARIGFGELAEGQAVSAQTAAALKSTGEAANVSQKHIEDYASSLSRIIPIDDEIIQAGENVLLSFKSIRNEVGKGNDIFDRATKIAADYAVRTGKDMSQAALIFGKALENPLKMSGALSRAGIVLTQGQKDQIKAFEDSGQHMKAQKLLLAGLEERYKGAGEAAGKTLSGQLEIAKNQFREMAASLVQALLPAFTRLAEIVSRVSSFLSSHKSATQGVVLAVAALASAVLIINAGLKVYEGLMVAAKVATVAYTVAQWALNVALSANPIGAVIVALAALAAGLVLLWRHSATFRAIVTGAFNAVKAAASAVLGFFKANWPIIAALISGPFAPIVLLATDAFGIRSKLVAAATVILDFFRNHWKTIAVLISGPFAPLVVLATDAFGIRSALVGAFGFIVNGVREKVGALIRLVAGIPRAITRALGDLGGLLYNAGVQIIQGLINGITAKLGALYGLVSGIAGKIAGLKGPLEKDRKLLVPQGRAIIEGLLGGLQDRLPDLERLVSGIAPAIGGGVGGAGPASLGFSSGAAPSSAYDMAPAGAYGGGAEATLHTHVYLDKTQIAEVVRREYLRFEKRNGRAAL